jgi:iron complex transport system permease protein
MTLRYSKFLNSENHKKILRRISFVILLSVVLFLFLITIFHDGNKFIDSWNSEYTFNITVIAAFAIFISYFLITYAGSTVQYISGNPIASPFTMGIIPAATTGLLIYKISEGISQPLFYLIQVSLIIAIVLIFLVIDLKVSGNTKIIVALVLSILISTINVLIASLFNQYQLVTLYFALTSQNFILTKLVGSLIVGVPALVLLLIFKNKIAVYSSLSSRSATMGINEIRLKFIVYICVALIAGASVIALGPISLVGLLVPNLLRVVGVRNYFANCVLSSLVSVAFGLLTRFLSIYFIFDLFSIQAYILTPLFLVMLFAARKNTVYNAI